MAAVQIASGVKPVRARGSALIGRACCQYSRNAHPTPPVFIVGCRQGGPLAPRPPRAALWPPAGAGMHDWRSVGDAGAGFQSRLCRLWLNQSLYRGRPFFPTGLTLTSLWDWLAGCAQCSPSLGWLHFRKVEVQWMISLSALPQPILSGLMAHANPSDSLQDAEAAAKLGQGPDAVVASVAVLAGVS